MICDLNGDKEYFSGAVLISLASGVLVCDFVELRKFAGWLSFSPPDSTPTDHGMVFMRDSCRHAVLTQLPELECHFPPCQITERPNLFEAWEKSQGYILRAMFEVDRAAARSAWQAHVAASPSACRIPAAVPASVEIARSQVANDFV